MNNWLEARAKLEEYGTDSLCQDIADTMTLTAIAKKIKVSIGSLLTWIDADPERSARVREVRISTAKLWDEKAEDGIANAPDEFELKRAKEMAHHYRWRAAKIAPKDYGDKIQTEHSGSIDVTPKTDDELKARAAALLGKLKD